MLHPMARNFIIVPLKYKIYTLYRTRTWRFNVTQAKNTYVERLHAMQYNMEGKLYYTNALYQLGLHILGERRQTLCK